MVGTNVHGGLVSLAGREDGAGTGERVGVLAHRAHNVTLLVPILQEKNATKIRILKKKRVSRMILILQWFLFSFQVIVP